MTEKIYDVVILTDDRYVQPKDTNWYINNILEEDGLVLNALKQKGLKAIRKSWSDPDFDWQTTKSVIFRTTWDYFDRYEEWKEWLEETSKKTQMINPYSLIKWNMDKHYLGDLQQRGINIPETIFIETGSSTTLKQEFEKHGWTEAILKPCISGAARLTYRISQENLEEHEKQFQKLIAQEAFMLQPFQHNVLSEGEVSYMVMGGQFTHAVLKKAKPGDFRVQDDFGGTVHDYSASLDEISFAESVVAACDPQPNYARVDVIIDNHGQLAVIEMELIEPELWFRMNPQAAEILAESINLD